MTTTQILKWAAVIGAVILTAESCLDRYPQLGIVAVGLFLAAAILNGQEQRDRNDQPGQARDL
jgi:hypothetical protein